MDVFQFLSGVPRRQATFTPKKKSFKLVHCREFKLSLPRAPVFRVPDPLLGACSSQLTLHSPLITSQTLLETRLPGVKVQQNSTIFVYPRDVKTESIQQTERRMRQDRCVPGNLGHSCELDFSALVSHSRPTCPRDDMVLLGVLELSTSVL